MLQASAPAGQANHARIAGAASLITSPLARRAAAPARVAGQRELARYDRAPLRSGRAVSPAGTRASPDLRRSPVITSQPPGDWATSAAEKPSRSPILRLRL